MTCGINLFRNFMDLQIVNDSDFLNCGIICVSRGDSAVNEPTSHLWKGTQHAGKAYHPWRRRASTNHQG